MAMLYFYFQAMEYNPTEYTGSARMAATKMKTVDASNQPTPTFLHLSGT
jgi:hypothetical protein